MGGGGVFNKMLKGDARVGVPEGPKKYDIIYEQPLRQNILTTFRQSCMAVVAILFSPQLYAKHDIQSQPDLRREKVIFLHYPAGKTTLQHSQMNNLNMFVDACQCHFSPS